MKSEKGISLTSLVIYIIAMAMILGILSSITIYFHKNVNTIQSSTDNSRYITRLNQYMENDIKNAKSIIIDNSILNIQKSNGEEITYKYNSTDKGIYRNKVKLCSEVNNVEFIQEIVYDKTKIKININIGETETLTKSLEYILQN